MSSLAMKLAFEIRGEGNYSNCFARVYDVPAQMRTVAFDSQPIYKSLSTTYAKFSLPRVAFAEYESDTFPYHQLFIFIAREINSRRDHSLIPFPFPNTSCSGRVCLDYYIGDNGLSPIDYFWQSKFTTPPTHKIPIDRDEEIQSLEQWEWLTQENPNFMEERFDPNNFAARSEYFLQIRRTPMGRLQFEETRRMPLRALSTWDSFY